MDETLIRAIVAGCVLAAIGVTGTLIWKLIRSKTETARRTRWVLGSLIGLYILYAALVGFGPGATIVLACIMAAGVWISRGTKTKT